MLGRVNPIPPPFPYPGKGSGSGGYTPAAWPEIAQPGQAVKGKPFAELFQDFFTKMNGRALTTEEVLAVKKLREEASKSE